MGGAHGNSGSIIVILSRLLGGAIPNFSPHKCFRNGSPHGIEVLVGDPVLEAGTIECTRNRP